MVRTTRTENEIGSKKRLTTHRADRGRGVGETHVFEAGVGVVSVNAGRVHQFWGLAVFESEMLEGGLHCRLQMRGRGYEGGGCENRGGERAENRWLS
jgi:hypothetical protein